MTQHGRDGKARRLSDVVTQKLRDLIITGELADGERLVVQYLADWFDTSRGPVRDALRQLEEEGLVTPLPRRGVQVAALTPQVAEEIISIRQALEPVAVRFAMRRDQAELEARLEEKVEELRKAARDGDEAAVVVVDMEFHATLYELSHRRRLQRIWDSLRIPLLHTFRHHRQFYRHAGELVAEHEDLLSVVRTGNVRLTERAFYNHPAGLLDELLPQLEKNTSLAGDEGG